MLLSPQSFILPWLLPLLLLYLPLLPLALQPHFLPWRQGLLQLSLSGLFQFLLLSLEQSLVTALLSIQVIPPQLSILNF